MSGIEAWRNLLRHTFEFSSGEALTPTAPLFIWTGWTLCQVRSAGDGDGMDIVDWSAGLAQGGFVFAPEALVPKIERLSPAQKLGQIFSLTGLSGLLKSLLPFAAIAYVGFAALREHWIAIVVASNTSLWTFTRFLLTVVFEVAWKSALVLLAWSMVDYFLTWRKSESDLRMSREEMRQETKDSDGNPQIKMRIRRLQRQMRRQLMLRETEKATVVVTNPTHFAVAILYSDGHGRAGRGRERPEPAGAKDERDRALERDSGAGESATGAGALQNGGRGAKHSGQALHRGRGSSGIRVPRAGSK